MHHHFIYAKLEELYLVNSKKVLIVQFNSKTLKDTKVQIRKIGFKKQLVIRKATVLKGRKFGNIFNEQYETIVYCIVDTIYTVLDGINFVVSSLMLLVKGYMVEKFFQVPDVSAKLVALGSAF